MLEFGWAELLIIVAVAIFVIGPKDIPGIMYAIGRFVRRLQYIRYAVTQQLDDVLQAGDVEELRKGVNIETMRTTDDVRHEMDVDLDTDTIENNADKTIVSKQQQDDKKDV